MRNDDAESYNKLTLKFTSSRSYFRASFSHFSIFKNFFLYFLPFSMNFEFSQRTEENLLTIIVEFRVELFSHRAADPNSISRVASLRQLKKRCVILRFITFKLSVRSFRLIFDKREDPRDFVFR